MPAARRPRASGRAPTKWLLDTNVLVYSFDVSAPEKCRRARDLIAASLSTGRGMISYQVIQEFLHVAMRKFAVPLSADDCRLYLSEVLEPLCQVQSGLPLYRRGLAIHEHHGLAWYDALIVAAAAEAGCDCLYSEDMSDGQRLEGLVITNPFRG